SSGVGNSSHRIFLTLLFAFRKRQRNSYEKTIADENGEIVGTCYPLVYIYKASKSDPKPPPGYWTVEEFVSINSTTLLSLSPYVLVQNNKPNLFFVRYDVERASPVVEGRVPSRTETTQMQRVL
nr:hypothetical protein [Tanacetum cinerariifolium]